MAFRRGFKSQCERRATEFRKQLGLEPTSPLTASELAQMLDVTVWSINDIQDLPNEDSLVLNDADDDSWAALTLRIGSDNLVVYKPVLSVGRQNSVVMHELAHITLGHQLAEACVFEDGSLAPGNFSQDQEDEADWFAGTLLLPRVALLSIRRRGLTNATACDEFSVSESMLTWRFRMTGVDYQISRQRG